MFSRTSDGGFCWGFLTKTKPPSERRFSRFVAHLPDTLARPPVSPLGVSKSGFLAIVSGQPAALFLPLPCQIPHPEAA